MKKEITLEESKKICLDILIYFDKFCKEHDIKYSLDIISVLANKGKPEDMPLAHKYTELHLAGKDDEIPYKAMMLTTVVAEAMRMVALENAPDTIELPVGAIAIGNVAFLGIPGEPFNAVGRGIAEAEGWDMVITTMDTNGAQGYYPMQDSYDEGGYEARTSKFKAGTAEQLIKEGKEILGRLKK